MHVPVITLVRVGTGTTGITQYSVVIIVCRSIIICSCIAASTTVKIKPLSITSAVYTQGCYIVLITSIYIQHI